MPGISPEKLMGFFKELHPGTPAKNPQVIPAAILSAIPLRTPQRILTVISTGKPLGISPGILAWIHSVSIPMILLEMSLLILSEFFFSEDSCRNSSKI